MGEKKSFKESFIDYAARPCVVSAFVGIIISLLIILYTYNYAVSHDPTITNFASFLIQKQYRLLQFIVSLFPIGLGYYYGRLREELSESEKNAELLRRLIASKRKLREDEKTNIRRNPRISALSPREKEILFFVAEGMSNKEIAVKLYLSDKTVKTHLHNMSKLL